MLGQGNRLAAIDIPHAEIERYLRGDQCFCCSTGRVRPASAVLHPAPAASCVDAAAGSDHFEPGLNRSVDPRRGHFAAGALPRPLVRLGFMAIPNVKRFRPFCPTCNENFTVMAVLPKDTDVSKYLSDAVARHDHKAYQESKQAHFKIRVGQQKQKKAK